MTTRRSDAPPDRCCPAERLIVFPSPAITDLQLEVQRHAQIAPGDRKLANLKALCGELVRRLDVCSRSTIAYCRIIDALAPRAVPAD